MFVTDLRLLDPSRTDLNTALPAAAKGANLGRRTLIAADGGGLVSLNCSVPGSGGRRWRRGRPALRRRQPAASNYGPIL